MSRSLLQQLFFFLFAVLALSSCQGIKQRSTAETASYQLQGLQAHCLPLIDAFRTIVASEGVANASSAPLPAFPLLHSNRFLHDLSQFAILPAETQEWTSLAAKLAIQTRASENSNLNSPWSELDL